MNYQEGVEHMKSLCATLVKGEKKSFNVGNMVINYPGRKEMGDYRLTINGVAPTHTDMLKEIYDKTSSENIKEIAVSLDDIYTNGLNATCTDIFSKEFIEKIYWITLQEEINYPQPQYKGRKMPFQRYYEGALAKVLNIPITEIETRTNNHGGKAPGLLKTGNYPTPSFYS